jgi:ketohexokinase
MSHGSTIGAGDTFIAGILFHLVNHGGSCGNPSTALEFASRLAGFKVRMEGFDGLGKKMLQ